MYINRTTFRISSRLFQKSQTLTMFDYARVHVMILLWLFSVLGQYKIKPEVILRVVNLCSKGSLIQRGH